MHRQGDMFPATGPSFTAEDRFTGIVCGVDEAGVGPLAGPVVAAAVILDRRQVPQGIDDSKRLSAKRRDELFAELMSCAEIGVGEASVEEIDCHNILQATLLAMRRAVAALAVPPAAVLVDGNRDPNIGLPTRCIVGGDSSSFSIAAAGIIAKVTRDRYMMRLAKQYPGYGWRTNVGYGVPKHLRALASLGPTPHHRRSFAPIRDLSLQDSLITS